jgi:hypothetical protein
MRLPTLLVLLPALSLASPFLTKRCRIGYSIQPCWVKWDHSECEAYVPRGVTYSFDEPNHTVTITGLCSSCSRALGQEGVRKWDDSWATAFGSVEDKGNGTVVISYSEASDRERNNVEFLKGLRMDPRDWANSCVVFDGEEECAC